MWAAPVPLGFPGLLVAMHKFDTMLQNFRHHPPVLYKLA